MSGYVPNDRNVKKESPPTPYNGNFDQQAPRPLEASSQAKTECLVGMRFIWDNGELLAANTPYLLAPDQGAALFKAMYQLCVESPRRTTRCMTAR